MQGICCLRVYSFNLIHIPILIIEHNIEFISHVADYLVDVGRNAGNKGNTKARTNQESICRNGKADCRKRGEE